MKQIYGMLLSFAMMLQLTVCGGNQASVTGTATTSAPVVSSSAAEPTPPPALGSVPPPSVSKPSSSTEPSSSTTASEKANMNQITITVGRKAFSATLTDNQAAREFTAYLPMTVRMGDLNGQEKFYALPDNLHADSTERPSTIRSGDIFCWSGNTLVLFYATFQNSYGGYVRLGTVDDPAELAATLGSDNAEVTWSLAE